MTTNAYEPARMALELVFSRWGVMAGG